MRLIYGELLRFAQHGMIESISILSTISFVEQRLAISGNSYLAGEHLLAQKNK